MRLVACATAGPKGSPHVDAVESHQLYLPGYPPDPSAALRPDTMNAEPMDVWLTRPKGRSLFNLLFNFLISKHLSFFSTTSHVVRG